jgi:hypothetical protein
MRDQERSSSGRADLKVAEFSDQKQDRKHGGREVEIDPHPDAVELEEERQDQNQGIRTIPVSSDSEDRSGSLSHRLEIIRYDDLDPDDRSISKKSDAVRTDFDQFPVLVEQPMIDGEYFQQ